MNRVRQTDRQTDRQSWGIESKIHRQMRGGEDSKVLGRERKYNRTFQNNAKRILSRCRSKA